MVEAIAKEKDISTSLFADAYSRRKRELEEGRKLKEVHTKKRITV